MHKNYKNYNNHNDYEEEEVSSITATDALFLVIIGIGITFFAGYQIKLEMDKFSQMDAKTKSTQVTFTKTQGHGENKPKWFYTPIYHYNVDGIDYTCKSKMSSNHPPSNRSKTVHYDSGYPSSCYIITPGIFMTFGLGFLGGLFMVFSCIIQFFRKNFE